MQAFSYDLEVKANSQNEADQKMTAISTIASKLSTKELEKLAWIIKNDPVKTALAKKALGV